MDINQDVVKFAKKKYPDISDELIAKNDLSFRWAMDAEANCRICLGLEMCSELNNTGGFTTALELDSKNGQIATVTVPCQFCKATVKPKRTIKNYKLEV